MKSEKDEKLIRYQRDCYRVLWDVFEFQSRRGKRGPELVREMGLAMFHFASQQMEIEQRISRKDKVDSLLYAPEDRKSALELLTYLPGVQALEIDATTLATLTTLSMRRVLLLMSIDLLHCLEYESEYSALYQQLKVFEHEKMIVVVYLRACHWHASFESCSVINPDGPAIRTLQQESRLLIFEQIAAKLMEQADTSAFIDILRITSLWDKMP